MTSRADMHGQATTARASRQKNVRARAAARVLARARWLAHHLVAWTGAPGRALRLAGAPLPVRTLVQDALIGRLPGLYAVGFDTPHALQDAVARRTEREPAEAETGPFHLRVAAVTAVTPGLVADTARAIEAAAQYPRAASRFVGRVDEWCAASRLRLDQCRRETEAVAHSRGSSPTPGDHAARVMRVGAGMGSSAAREDPEADAALLSVWADERILDSTPVTTAERAELEGLLAAIAAARREPFRRDESERRLAEWEPDGSPLDPAGGAAIVAAAVRLRRMGAADAYAAFAAWLDACRPLVPLASFWREILAVVASGTEPSSPERARAFAWSLSAHARNLAEAVFVLGRLGTSAQTVLPAALARGPDATALALRHQLWLPNQGAQDAALRFVNAAGRAARDAGPHAVVPLPRRVFESEREALRDALLEFGLAMWTARAADAPVVSYLLDMILTAASRDGAASWGEALPRLRNEGALFLRRASRSIREQDAGLVGDAPVLALFGLDVCARWIDAGFGDPRKLAQTLAARWMSSEQAAVEWDPDHDDHNRLLVRLSEGRPARLLLLLRLPRASRRQAWRALDGLAVVERHEAARAWVSAGLDRTELAGRVVRLLDRLGLLARIEPGTNAAKVFGPLDGAVPSPRKWPTWVTRADALVLDAIRRARLAAGSTGDLPRPLERLLDRAAVAERERAALRARAGRRALSPSEGARMSRLEAMAEDPSALKESLAAALRKALPKQRALSGLAALEAVVAGALDRRWAQALGAGGPPPHGPAWDNALLMLESVAHNKRVLRRLLREAARGDQTWIRTLDPNRGFLARLVTLGVDPDAWLAGRQRLVEAGGSPLTVYAATDPLEALQMGSLFGTCLSADRFNAHAAVAAAVEVNKRVLYVRDGAGRILGRQLVAILPSCEIVGFTCYGSGLDDRRRTGLKVRLSLALLALDIARASGARLMTTARIADGLTGEEERALSLFCRGYVDTPEPFDWWIEELASQSAASGGGGPGAAQADAAGRGPRVAGRAGRAGLEAGGARAGVLRRLDLARRGRASAARGQAGGSGRRGATPPGTRARPWPRSILEGPEAGRRNDEPVRQEDRSSGRCEARRPGRGAARVVRRRGSRVRDDQGWTRRCTTPRLAGTCSSSSGFSTLARTRTPGTKPARRRSTWRPSAARPSAGC